MTDKKKQEEFINPVDKDKVAESPGNLPYAHHVGSSVIQPIDKKGEKGTALAIMEEQAQMQLSQIQEQVQLLVQQASKIKGRVEISQKIYEADINFVPVVGDVYHLFEKRNGLNVLSMISPSEWGEKMPFKNYLGSVKLLSDRTWLPVD